MANPVLRAHATAMRHAPTRSEELLWRALKSRQLGVSFRRQVVLARFIVDFYASSIRLVVEVDGGYHADHVGSDQRRERELRKRGLHIVRVSDQMVVHHLPQARALILRAIAAAALQ